MKTLDRHIGFHVIRDCLLTLMALLAVFSLIEFLDDVGDVGRGSYTMADALEYMLLSAPNRAAILFPVAAVIGSLIGLGSLASHRELIVIRATGVSSLRIAGSALKAAAVLMVAAVVVGEVLAPYTQQLAQQRRTAALSENRALDTGKGFWIRDGNTFINVGRVLPGNLMGELYIYEFDEERQLRVATYADRASYEGGEWTLEGIRQSHIGKGGVIARDVVEADWRSAFKPELVEVVTVRVTSLSIPGLMRYIDYLRTNDLDTTRYELALWNKLVHPFATAVMIFMALPLVLGRLGTFGIGPRIVVGVVVAMAFLLLQRMAGQLGLSFGLNPVVSALLPSLAFLMLALLLFRRVG
ncbi:MAG: LPS export ABC transporter permease LptG [Gammaproteobacteria bacterium]|nr:LPS export ABC transporter permease LptG [Gammaproteobacteria bacterium]NIM75061.1 LPS export ABC transporter permease LptG [Gammaproteobacteria bacterium]NIN40111.1 LPS export ABC transporter permease LptG [Gammaproteobacteria bacterium]NIO26598.1 LPS export ABC transporter permease LptG [Gammaproteobacteria bacterium]NIO67150.1 LPS export ABC transporter permease LptG [Gammaproteobacteria bacterium]